MGDFFVRLRNSKKHETHETKKIIVRLLSNSESEQKISA